MIDVSELRARSRAARRSRTVIMTAILAAAAVLAAGCGSTDPQPAAPAPAGPVIVGKGTLDTPVEIATTGRSVFSVRTVTLPPGAATGWHVHDGTEMSIVKSGAVTLVRAGACEPVVFEAGEAVFVPDGAAHLARNDGSTPADIVVTYLLAPGAPDRADAAAAC